MARSPTPPDDVIIALGTLLANGVDHPEFETIKRSKSPVDVMHLVASGSGQVSLWHWDIRLTEYSRRSGKHAMRFATSGKQVVDVTWSAGARFGRLEYEDLDDGATMSLGMISGFLRSLADGWDPTTEREIAPPKQLVDALAKVRGG